MRCYPVRNKTAQCVIAHPCHFRKSDQTYGNGSLFEHVRHSINYCKTVNNRFETEHNVYWSKTLIIAKTE